MHFMLGTSLRRQSLMLTIGLMGVLGCQQDRSRGGNNTSPKATKTAQPAKASTSAKKSEAPSDQALCGACHGDIVKAFKKSPKASTIAAPNTLFKDTSPARSSTVVAHPKLPITYRAYTDAEGRWWQEERVNGTAYVRKVEAHYAIGAQNGVRSFIARDTSQLTLLPLSWSEKSTSWRLTDGFERADQERFTKAVKSDCVSCHGKLEDESRTLTSVRCHDCHGDGHGHVAFHQANPSNPKTEDPMKRTVGASLEKSAQVCQRCHLEGVVRFRRDNPHSSHFDITDIGRHLAVYVDRASGVPSEAASRLERLQMSACAKASGERLTCTTCHSPHTNSALRAQREACVSCHTAGKTQCSDPASRGGAVNCAGCHMKNQGAVPEVHQGYTDHRISRPAAQRATDPETVGKTLAGVLGVPSDPSLAELQRWMATVLLGVEDNYRGTLLIPATKALSASLTERPKRHLAWEILGRGYLDMGERKKAIRALGRAIEGPNPNTQLFLRLAKAYAADENLAAATRVLVTALERDPDSGLAWGRLGGMLQMQGNFVEAENAYAKAVSFFPNDSGLLSNRAYNQLEAKAPDVAIRHFQKAYQLDPLNFDASIGLADVHITAGRLEAAHTLMTEALSLDPRQVGVYINLGRIAFKRKDYLNAGQHFDRALALAPHDPMLYVERARIAEAAGDLDGARAIIERGRARIGTFEHWDQFLPASEQRPVPSGTPNTP